MISCSSEPKSSSRSPLVINENKQRYCLVDKWTFPIDSTAVVDGGEDDDDVIADSNVVGECVRTRLQFRFNNVVIVSFEGEKDIMVGGRSTMLLENWRKREKEKTNGDKRQRISWKKKKRKKNEKNRRIYLHNCDTSAKLIDEYEWCRSAGRCLAFVTSLEWQSNWIDRWKDKHFFLFSRRRSLKHLLPLIIKKCSIEKISSSQLVVLTQWAESQFRLMMFSRRRRSFFLFNTNLLNSTSNRCSNKKFIHINDRYENIDRHSPLSKTIKKIASISSQKWKRNGKKMIEESNIEHV